MPPLEAIIFFTFFYFAFVFLGFWKAKMEGNYIPYRLNPLQATLLSPLLLVLWIYKQLLRLLNYLSEKIFFENW